MKPMFTRGPLYWRRGTESIHIFTQNDRSNIPSRTHVAGLSMSHRPEEEVEANARLFCAAGDLYSAASDATEYVERFIEMNGEPEDGDAARVLACMRAAIAKALYGEKPNDGKA